MNTYLENISLQIQWNVITSLKYKQIQILQHDTLKTNLEKQKNLTDDCVQCYTKVLYL